MSLSPGVQWILDQPDVQQGTEKWLHVRKFGITASTAAHAVQVGFAPYRTKLFFAQSDKAILEKTGFIERFFGNACTAHGHKWEPVALDHAAKSNECEAFQVGLLVHPSLRWLGASPDGVLANGMLIEIKVPFKRQVKAGNPVPLYYWIQMQIQMEVCNADSCLYYEFRPPSARIKEVRTNEMIVFRDKEWFAAALPLLQEYAQLAFRLRALRKLFQ